jgi:hypothetical protein
MAPACEREDCDRALAVVCACTSRPCDRPDPPAFVTALRRCDENDVRPGNDDDNFHLCIQEVGPRFCDLIDGLATDDPGVCELSCTRRTSSCLMSIKRQCNQFQYERCDLPDGGAG